MQERDNILEMRKIDKLFPGVKALDGVDFSVRRGEVHCLIGANGAGKSTLMKILSGAYVEDGGEIIFDGEKLKPHGTLERKKKGISVIYQELSANPASCQCFHCIGTCTSQTENSNLSCTQTVNSLLT